MDDSSRMGAADRLDDVVRRSRLLSWLMAPIWVIAIVDLALGYPIDDRRIDVVMLAALPLQLWGLFNLQRSARGIREGSYPRRPTPGVWIRAAASVVLSLAFTVGAGYLVAAWIGSVALTGFTLAASAVGIGASTSEAVATRSVDLIV